MSIERGMARREFRLDSSDGTARAVFVAISSPYIDPDDDRLWRCDIEISHPRAGHTAHSTGADSLQALASAMRQAIGFIRGLSMIDGDRISFLGESDLLLGLPSSIVYDGTAGAGNRPDNPPEHAALQ